MMNDEESRALKVIAEEYDALILKFAGLAAIVGALAEKYPLDLSRVDAWCREISRLSDSVGQTATQRVAHDLLQGITEESET